MEQIIENQKLINFLTDLIVNDKSVYVFKIRGGWKRIASITRSRKQIFLDPELLKINCFIDELFEFHIYFSKITSTNQYTFSIKSENIQLCLSILDDLDLDFYLIYWDKSSYLKNCMENTSLIFRGNYDWDVIDFYGIFIRYKYYYGRYSDFGISNYKINIVGNPNYINQKSNCEIGFDIFDEERMRIKSWFPSEIICEKDIYSFGDGRHLLNYFLSKAFDFYFQQKEFICLNYDQAIQKRIKFDSVENLTFLYSSSFYLSINMNLGLT